MVAQGVAFFLTRLAVSGLAVQGRNGRKIMTAIFIAWAIASIAYILFAGQFSGDELVAAVACGCVASLWSASLRRSARRGFRFERGACGAALRACAGVPGAAGKVGVKLLQATISAAGGELKREAFIHGHPADPAAAGRRAVAVLARSLAPDSFVVRTSEGEDAMVVHALVKAPAGEPRWAA